MRIMDNRLTCLTVAHYSNPANTEVGTVAVKPAHCLAFTKFKLSKAVVEQLKESDNTEPYDKLADISSLSFVLFSLENINITSNADVKTEKQRLRDIIAKYTGLIAHLGKQTVRISNAVKKHLENEEKLKNEESLLLAKEQAEGRSRASAATRLAVTGAKQPSPVITSYAVLKVLDHLPTYGIKPVRAFKEPDEAFFELHPSVCHRFSDLKEPPGSLVTSVETFVNEQFKTSPSYTGTGRGAQITQHKFVIDTGKFVIGAENTDMLGKLSAAEKQYCQSAWMFAYSPTMKSCAPEFGFLGSLKWTLKGTRNALLCTFDGACRYAVAVLGEEVESLTPARVCHLVQECDETHWPALIKECGPDGIFGVHRGEVIALRPRWLDRRRGCGEPGHLLWCLLALRSAHGFVRLRSALREGLAI